MAVTAAVACVLASGSQGRTARDRFTSAKAREYLGYVDSYIASERKAIDLIGTNDKDARTHVGLTSDALGRIAGYLQDLYSVPGPSPIPDLRAAEHFDTEAFNALAKKPPDRKAALAALAEALKAKKKAATIFDNLIATAPEATTTTSTGKTCEVTKPFPVYAVPAGYSGSNSDVFPHGIPSGAKDISVSFIDEATGKAPAPDVFPGQTWSVEVRGFQPDGTFDVRVNVTGKGLGKPDANAKNWKVVVRYAC